MHLINGSEKTEGCVCGRRERKIKRERKKGVAEGVAPQPNVKTSSESAVFPME